MRPRSLELRNPRSQQEWDRYHEIRKRCLFDRYHPPGSLYYFEYDPNHPDERLPTNHPLVFLAEGLVIGTIRVDFKLDGRAVFRMVAIDDPWRGHGLGTSLMHMAEAYAREGGATSICLNSVADAYSFYARNGFHPYRWDGCTHNHTEIPVIKELPIPNLLAA